MSSHGLSVSLPSPIVLYPRVFAALHYLDLLLVLLPSGQIFLTLAPSSILPLAFSPSAFQKFAFPPSATLFLSNSASSPHSPLIIHPESLLPSVSMPTFPRLLPIASLFHAIPPCLRLIHSLGFLPWKTSFFCSYCLPTFLVPSLQPLPTTYFLNIFILRPTSCSILAFFSDPLIHLQYLNFCHAPSLAI